MKVVLIIGCIATLVAILACCGKKKQADLMVLNYENMILLDAEELSEGSIGALYKKDIVPILEKYVGSPAALIEILDAESGSYKVTSQKQIYVIYSPEMELDEGQNWGNATFALFDIVNRQLQNSSVRFYAINGGNDLGGMFLTEQTYNQAVKSLRRKTDWPYLPEAEPPWYGQPHG